MIIKKNQRFSDSFFITIFTKKTSMIIAKEKRKTNIFEYLIYMFQIEDIIRAHNFDTIKIKNYAAKVFLKFPDQSKEIESWYLGLTDLMIEENIKVTGHLTILTNIIDELNDFHKYILQTNKYPNYNLRFQNATQYITDFEQRSNTHNKSDIYISIHAMYSKLLLKLKKVNISDSTEEAFSGISNFLSLLSLLYQQYESGDLKLDL